MQLNCCNVRSELKSLLGLIVELSVMLSSMVRQLASLLRASELTVAVSLLDKWLTLANSPLGLMVRFLGLGLITEMPLSDSVARQPLLGLITELPLSDPVVRQQGSAEYADA